MLFLDDVYVKRPDGSLRFRWVKAPTSAEVVDLHAGLTLHLQRGISTAQARRRVTFLKI